jgi:hypothetical protein
MPGSSCVPALPGATYSVPHEGDCVSFQAKACSRPPLPTTSTFCCLHVTTRRRELEAAAWLDRRCTDRRAALPTLHAWAGDAMKSVSAS